jgi:hypothetical protein
MKETFEDYNFKNKKSIVILNILTNYYLLLQYLLN